MNTFEQEFEAFKKIVCKRAVQIMKQREEVLASKRVKGRAPDRCSGRDASARSARKVEVIGSAGPPMLTGWKEIAQAIGNVSTRTVQRWEKHSGLPVGRIGNTPVADPQGLREWKEQNFQTTSKLR